MSSEWSEMWVSGFLLTFCSLLMQMSFCQQPEVILSQGKVRGLYSKTSGGRSYSTFLSVPYGKPPVGKHRFKEPVAADPWLGVYNATRYPPECLQYSHKNLGTPINVHGSEDCLYINIYTPQISEDSTKKSGDRKLLDVIAFIHGGAFMFSTPNNLGANLLLDRDLVLVTISYRLGPLGFLSTQDSVIPGNNGMKDQSLALKWIQENIVEFGGDPGEVTLVGNSAGGASVHLHLLSPISKGLFKNAIFLSGSSLNPWTIAEKPREKAFFVAENLGCPTVSSRAAIRCLRNRPAEHIVWTTKYLQKWLYNPFSPYAPVVEPAGTNAFLSRSPIDIIKQGNSSDVPILFIFDKEEGLYPGAQIVGNPKYLIELKNRWNELLPFVLDYNHTVPSDKNIDEISEKIKDYYQVDLETKEGITSLIKLIGDRIFIHGISKTAKLHAKIYTSPVYMYRFSYSGKYTFSSRFGGSTELGVSHADDLLYVLSMAGKNVEEMEKDKKMSKEMIDIWETFATTGKLNSQTIGENLPKVFFTDIRGPGQYVGTLVDQLGEEDFWDSFDFLENMEAPHDEL